MTVACQSSIKPELGERRWSLGPISPIDGTPKIQVESREALRLYGEFAAGSLAKAGFSREVFQAKGRMQDVATFHDTSSEKALPSSHIVRKRDDGTVEEIVLALQLTQRSKAKLASSGASKWIIPSPDVFYLEDDENGHEAWPVKAKAYSLEEDGVIAEVEFTAAGLISQDRVSLADVIFLTTMAIEEDKEITIEPSKRALDGTSGVRTQFIAVFGVTLQTSGDGDGAAELQLRWDDHIDYNNDFSRYHNSRWDALYPNGTRMQFSVNSGNYRIYPPDVNFSNT
jgi:hypothetical protein